MKLVCFTYKRPGSRFVGGSTGPRCDDCAYEHEAYEQARADEDEDESDSPEARS